MIPLDTRADGVYGRLNGDVTFSAAGFAELSAQEPAPGLRVSGHYYWTAGLSLSYARPAANASSRHLLGMAVDLRPAFLPRWLLGKQRGPSTLDLFVDSISASVGPYWAQSEDQDWGALRGLELGAGFGVPLFGRAQGLWFDARGLLRFPDDGDAGWGAQLGLAWHLPWTSPLVD